MSEPLQLLLGTTKGAFILTSDDRQDWAVAGPFCDGWPINHVIGDPASGRIWAAGGSDWHGPGVWRSDDRGQSWTLSQDGFAADLKTLWSLGRAGSVLYAGAKPARLLESHDQGASWQEVTGLSRHPSGPGWEPGAAGLVLHSIVSDPDEPQKLWVGISVAGVFASEDAGATWERRNRKDNSVPHGDGGPEVMLCVHNLVRAPGDLLYQQNHRGVWRSRDGGRNWQEITAGLPSNFGFPVAVHPRDPATLWVFPLNGDSQGRFPPDARAQVWRSRDGGDSWQGLGQGLPERDCFFTVLRQAMAVDLASPTGLYFGTNSGSVFASRDEGDSWSEIARHLPTILSVETLQPG